MILAPFLLLHLFAAPKSLSKNKLREFPIFICLLQGKLPHKAQGCRLVPQPWLQQGPRISKSLEADIVAARSLLCALGGVEFAVAKEPLESTHVIALLLQVIEERVA